MEDLFNFVIAIAFAFLATSNSTLAKKYHLNTQQTFSLALWQFTTYGMLYYVSNRYIFHFIDKTIDIPFINLYTSVFAILLVIISKNLTHYLIIRDKGKTMDNIIRRHHYDPSKTPEQTKQEEINFVMYPMLTAMIYFLVSIMVLFIALFFFDINALFT